MSDINVVTISGRLGRDIEVRFSQSGKAVASFSVAVQEGYKAPGATEWTNITHWIDCELWGKPAEFLASHSHKGSTLVISGSLKQNKWEKDGVKHSKTLVAAKQVHVCQDRSDIATSETQERAQPKAAPSSTEQQSYADESSMPF